MTKRLILLLAVTLTSTAFAQDEKDELQMIKALFGMNKDSIVNEFVKVEGANKQKFKALYAEFETVRRDLGQKKFKVLNNYVKTHNSLPEPELDKIMLEIIRLSASQDKLIARYYEKMKKTCGIAVAAQFYQIEWYLLSEIRTAILENIPVINDLDKRN